jgi:hypothetical protein
MQTITVARAREHAMPASVVVAYAGAAAFVVAAVWATLASAGVTVASEPTANPSISVARNQQIHLRWLASTQPQERVYTAVAIVAFICLAATARSLRERRRSAIASLGVLGIGIGIVLWITENVLHLGATYAVGMLTTHNYGLDTVTGIEFTADMMQRALEVTGFAILGLGMTALSLEAFGATERRPGWGALTVAIGVAMIVEAWSSLAGAGTVGDILVAVTGAILLPAWMIATGRALPERGRP